MRSVSKVLMLMLVAAASASPVGDKPHYDLNRAQEYFEQFIKDYNRVYKDDADREAHFRAFVHSLEEINKSNELSDSATFDINHLADYTEEEMRNLFGEFTEAPKV